MSAKPTHPTGLGSGPDDNDETRIPHPTANHDATEPGGVAIKSACLVNESNTELGGSSGVEETSTAMPEFLDAFPLADLVSKNATQDDRERLRLDVAGYVAAVYSRSSVGG